VVTGAASGLGQAFAVRLASEGARVVLADVSDTAETAHLAQAAGGQVIPIICDVSSEESVAALGEQVASAGGADILLNNAGIAPFQPFADVSFADWRRVMAVNLDSAFLLANVLVPTMRGRGWGRVICIASGTFHLGSPNQPHYVASKGGIIGFVRALAADVGADGVTVNAIAPGLIETTGTLEGPQQAMGLFERAVSRQAIRRTGMPDDLVGLASFLASGEASFITGQTILVDGGLARA
jgi:NAD(P)-dependent dehydrogenase (short-subunit alcohol dehydrogenase family)